MIEGHGPVDQSEMIRDKIDLEPGTGGSRIGLRGLSTERCANGRGSTNGDGGRKRELGSGSTVYRLERRMSPELSLVTAVVASVDVVTAIRKEWGWNCRMEWGGRRPEAGEECRWTN